MPQTNIGLKKGESIKVRDIILSLIVRSANDSAVAIAEFLGKSESGFARLMTAKARKLGMNNTVFRNASGLPDKKQLTTARDLAVLALAIKKHFPQYFHFFRTPKFRYRGKTYKSHNKVMKRYPGVDGMKTGYIRASGFNLVTSVKRNGRSLIAVVMGGKTGRRRDDHMIDLLDRSFAKLEKMGRFAAAKRKNLPLPQAKPILNKAGSKVIKVTKLHGSSAISKKDILPTPIPKQWIIPDDITNVATGKKIAKAGQFLPSPSVKNKSLSIAAVKPREKPVYKDWGIQVGAFDNRKVAYKAITRAMKVAGTELSHSRAAISDIAGKKFGQVVYRARLANLTEDQARRACKVLLYNNESCFVFQVKNASDL